jgi:hypothetical protein
LGNPHTRVLISGFLGALGALLIVIADVVYNLLGGDHLGQALYVSTYFGVFLFPLWWGGIWVMYLGLKPAGTVWSLYPCLLFAAFVTTLNASLHSSYPFWAAVYDMQKLATGEPLAALQQLESEVLPYTRPVQWLQPLFEATLCVWFTIPIVRGRTLFPRAMALLIPLYPLVALHLVGLLIPSFVRAVEPYVASSFMCVVVLVSTQVVYHKAASRGG